MGLAKEALEEKDLRKMYFLLDNKLSDIEPGNVDKNNVDLYLDNLKQKGEKWDEKLENLKNIFIGTFNHWENWGKNKRYKKYIIYGDPQAFTGGLLNNLTGKKNTPFFPTYKNNIAFKNSDEEDKDGSGKKSYISIVDECDKIIIDGLSSATFNSILDPEYKKLKQIFLIIVGCLENGKSKQIIYGQIKSNIESGKITTTHRIKNKIYKYINTGISCFSGNLHQI